MRDDDREAPPMQLLTIEVKDAANTAKTADLSWTKKQSNKNDELSMLK